MPTPIFTWSLPLPSDSTSYTNANTRQIIPAGVIPSGAKFRIAIRAHGTQGSNFPAVKMGHGVPSTFNFESTPATVKFNQKFPLQSGMIIQASDLVWSDIIDFEYDTAKPLLFHLYSSADGVRFASNGYQGASVPAGFLWGFKVGSDESSDLSVTGYTPSSAGAVLGIAAIEVYEEGEATADLFWQEVGKTLTFKFAAARRLAFRDSSVDAISIPAGFVEGQWCTVDLHDGSHWQGEDPHLPDVDDIIAIRAHVAVSLTHAGSGTAEVLLTARGPKIDPNPQLGYQVHAATNAPNGERQQTELDIPVIDGKFEVFWQRRNAAGLSGVDGAVTGFISEVRYRPQS